jgi:hypothetical protein
MFGQAMVEQMAVQTAIRPAELSAALLGSAVIYPSSGRRRSYDEQAAVRRQNAARRRSAAG